MSHHCCVIGPDTNRTSLRPIAVATRRDSNKFFSVLRKRYREVAMPGMNILCVFNDAAFSKEGFAALKQTSYLVTPADCAEEADRDFTKDNYQLVVIGPGLIRAAKERLALKAWESGCAVVVVCSDKDDYQIRADEHIDARESGVKLVPTVIKALTAKFFAVAV